MSACCVFTPVIVEMSWPVLSSMLTASLGAMGYEAISESVEQTTAERASVELDMKQSDEFAQTLGEEEKLALSKGNVTLTFAKAADGRLKACASSPSLSEADLRVEGDAALNAFMQAYVHDKVASELKKRGYTMSEEKLADGSIRLKARKYP